MLIQIYKYSIEHFDTNDSEKFLFFMNVVNKHELIVLAS